MKNNKDIRLLVRKIISEVELNMAGGATGWDSNNDISFFHGYPSGYGEFPFLHVDTPDMLPNAEEVNAEFENKTRFPLDKFTFGLDYERKINNNNQSEFDLARTTKLFFLEIESSEFNKYDFDTIWDAVRDVYEEDYYTVKKIEKINNKILVKLGVKSKKK